MIEHRSVDVASSRLAGNTWGMSGPQFLGWYVVFGAGAIGAMIVLLRRISDEDRLPPMDVSTLSTMQIAVLNGGAVPAVVALVELRTRGIIDVHGRVTGSRPTVGDLAPIDPVTRAVQQQLRPDRTVKARQALRRPQVRRAVDAMTEQLRKGGLVGHHGDAYVSRCAWATVPALALLVVGIARVVAGIAHQKPVGFLLFLVIVVGVSIPAALATIPSRTSPAGRRALRELQEGVYPHLDPSDRPSFPTYGPQSLALSVAVFGGAALVAAEPDFAYAVGARDAAALAGTAGDGDGGGGGGCGGGGGGCGGGGGGCGGGGGGCGGGGCGGCGG